jgi:cytochrome oxidase assembly protein ShyY1
VLLSQWQFGRSTQPEMPVSPTTEEVKELTGVLQPGEFFRGSVADQMVTATGSYDASKQVIIPGRLNAGKMGYWVVDAFAVDGAPALKGTAVSPKTWIPVARGWIADPAEASAPPSGSIRLTGRLLPSEAPVAGKAPAPGQATAVSVAELINVWNVSSYPAFVSATSEISGTSDVGAAAAAGGLEPLNIGAQPPPAKVNWLNLFYSVEWIVFAGFALFIWWRLVKDDYQRSLEEHEDSHGISGPGAADQVQPARTEHDQNQPKVQP